MVQAPGLLQATGDGEEAPGSRLVPAQQVEGVALYNSAFQRNLNKQTKSSSDPLVYFPQNYKSLGVIPDVPETNLLVKMSTHDTLLSADNIIATGSGKHCLYA